MNAWARSGSLRMDLAGRVYLGREPRAYIGDIYGLPLIDLDDRQWADWEQLAAEWREAWITAQIEAIDVLAAEDSP